MKQRLSLQLFREEDMEALLPMFFEKDCFQYIRPLQDKTAAQYQQFLSLKIKEIRESKGFYWVLRHNATNEIVGALNLTPIPGTEKMQIGWQIKTEHRGNNYAYEAAHRIMNDKQFHSYYPIYAVYDAENIASARILEKLAFEKLEEVEEEDHILIKKIKYLANQ